MHQVIGILILAIIFIGIFIAMAYAAGIEQTIIIWLISLAVADLIYLAVFLITK